MHKETQPLDHEIDEAININKIVDIWDNPHGESNNQLVDEIIAEDSRNLWTEASESKEGKEALDQALRETAESRSQMADFYLAEWQERTGNHSPDMAEAFRNLECHTGFDAGWGRMQKSLLGFEIGEKYSAAKTGGEVVYLGSYTDIHFPLSMRGRSITLVDPVFRDEPEMLDQLKSEIEKYGEFTMTQEDDAYHFAFEFDFGQGKEPVNVTLLPQGAEEYSPTSEIGMLLSFKGNGYTNPFKFRKLSEKMKEGAYIYDTDIAGFAGKIFNEITDRRKDYSKFTPDEQTEYQDKIQAAAGELCLEAFFVPGVEQPVYRLIGRPDKLAEYADEINAELAQKDVSLADLRAYIKSMPLGSLEDTSSDNK